MIFQLATESERALEEVDGPAQVSPDTVDMREAQTREDNAELVIDCFRNPDGLLSVSSPSSNTPRSARARAR